MLLTERAAVEHDERAEELLRRDSRATKHPVDGKLMTLVEEGIYLSGADGRSVWVEFGEASGGLGDLPTAPQWEKAARGPKGRVYPWGNEPTAAKCNVAETGMDATTPVSRYRSGASPYGVFDMCGNVWEWCSTEEKPGNGRYELKGSAFTSPFERAAPALRVG